ncbi:MAG TPA: glycosyltransferase family 2 protein, partial [Thermoanaerobaculia bacterium]|nr:glycosyltransferase family 2 protein [Thermoanaerobaculia bacterium]
NRGRARDRYLDRDRTEVFEVEQPAAAVLAVRAGAFARIGGFDPRFVPAWWEDVDLCARLRPLGKIVYYPDAVFEHTGGASAKALGYARFLPVYYRNAIAFWRKHHGTAAAGLFRILVAVGMLLRLAVLPFRRRDPRPKGESFRAYRGALRAAFS